MTLKEIRLSYIIITVVVIFYACKKKDTLLPPNPIITLPKLNTTEVTSISASMAFTGGTIIDTGTVIITAKGVCYSSKDTLPTLNNFKTINKTGGINFKDTLINLTGNTLYYVRAYASTNEGTAYGETKKFNTLKSAPTIFTAIADPKTITETTALLGGNIVDRGGTAIKEKGVCYSITNPLPVITKDNKVVVSGGTEVGNFAKTVNNLQPGETYYVRAYAINSTDTAYGQQYSFGTRSIPSTVTDGDGNIYHPILVGTQVWLQENLKTTKYNDGNPITLVEDKTNWAAQTNPAYCWYENNESMYKDVYGALYNWYVADANNPENVCPVGFRVPNKGDFTFLDSVVKHDANVLKSASYWGAPTGMTNSTNFSALPAGHRAYNGAFYNVGLNTYFWASAIDAFYLYLNYFDQSTHLNTNVKPVGFSIRCIRD